MTPFQFMIMASTAAFMLAYTLTTFDVPAKVQWDEDVKVEWGHLK